MALKTAEAVGTVDLAGGAIREVVKEVAEEMVEVYDLVRNTLLEVLTDPISPEEEQQILETLTADDVLRLMVEDPERARQVLR